MRAPLTRSALADHLLPAGAGRGQNDSEFWPVGYTKRDKAERNGVSAFPVRDTEGLISMPEQIIRGRQLRKAQTKAESRAWWLLRDRNLAGFKFRRQHPIGPFFVDFCCPELKLIIELEGGVHNPPWSRPMQAETSF